MGEKLFKIAVSLLFLVFIKVSNAASFTIMAIDGDPSKISWLRNGEVMKVELMADVELGDKFFIKDRSTVLKLLTSDSGVIRITSTDSPYNLVHEVKTASLLSNGLEWIKSLVDSNITSNSSNKSDRTKIEQVATASTRNSGAKCSNDNFSLSGLTQKKNYLTQNISRLVVPVSYCGSKSSVLTKSIQKGIVDTKGLAVTIYKTDDESYKLKSHFKGTNVSFENYFLPKGEYKIILTLDGKEIDSKKVTIKPSQLNEDFDLKLANLDELSALAIGLKDIPEWNFMAMQLAYNGKNNLLASSFADRQFIIVDKEVK